MPSQSWAEFQKTQRENQQRLRDNRGKGDGKGGDGKGGRFNGVPPWKYRMEFFDPKSRRTWIRLVPTTYAEPFFLHYSRWAGQPGHKKLVLSNSHNGDLDVPDLVFWNAVKMEEERPGSGDAVSARAQYAITVAVLEYFHRIHVANADPKKKGYDKYERCDGSKDFRKPKCPHCLNEAEGKGNTVKVFGQRKYWALSNRGRDELVELALEKLHTCASCGKGEVAPVRFKCSAPGCGKLIADRYDTSTELTDDDIDALLNSVIDCPHCNKEIEAVVEYACLMDDGSVGCDKPARMGKNIFDIEFQVEQDKDNYALFIHAVRPVQEHKELPGSMLRPMPFNEFLLYMSLEDQAKALGIQNPYGKEEEALVVEFFKTRAAATPSGAAPEEADPDSIPWNKQ